MPAVPATDEPDKDPFEATNREIWSFDLMLDRSILRPLARGYRAGTPEFAQEGLRNALNNLRSPVIMANDLLQGNFLRLSDSAERLVVNTLLGFGGLVDVAAKRGVIFHEADFGQTLGVWGMEPGPYLVLPLLGPSDARDAVGYGVDSLVDPVSYKLRVANLTEADAARTGLALVGGRARSLDTVEELEKSSLDFYAAIRSIYTQQRAAAVETGRTGGGPAVPVILRELELSKPDSDTAAAK